jgi:hypothetical protein
MQVSWRKTVVETVTEEVPDHFGSDSSKRGKIVDILIGHERREDLYSDMENVVRGAIYDLTEAYNKATKILCLFCEPKDAEPKSPPRKGVKVYG